MSHIFVEHVIKATLSKKRRRIGGIARLLAKKFMLLDLQPTRSVTERGGEMHKMLSDIKSSEERSRDLDTASLTRVQDQLFH